MEPMRGGVELKIQNTFMDFEAYCAPRADEMVQLAFVNVAQTEAVRQNTKVSTSVVKQSTMALTNLPRTPVAYD